MILELTNQICPLKVYMEGGLIRIMIKDDIRLFRQSNIAERAWDQIKTRMQMHGNARKKKYPEMSDCLHQ